jgi:hypothetical protein
MEKALETANIIVSRPPTELTSTLNSDNGNVSKPTQIRPNTLLFTDGRLGDCIFRREEDCIVYLSVYILQAER